ncbi:MAG: hypothetical protein MJ252_06130 [archaeon]|nr:hypothetical protein [archaeon]
MESKKDYHQFTAYQCIKDISEEESVEEDDKSNIQSQRQFKPKNKKCQKKRKRGRKAKTKVPEPKEEEKTNTENKISMNKGIGVGVDSVTCSLLHNNYEDQSNFKIDKDDIKHTNEQRMNNTQWKLSSEEKEFCLLWNDFVEK